MSIANWLTDDGLAQIKQWYHAGLTHAQIAENCGIRRKTLRVWCRQYPEIAEILCPKDGEGRVLIGETRGRDLFTLYLERMTGHGRLPSRCILCSRMCDLYCTSASSTEHIYIDEADLLGRRKPFIPVRRVQLGVRHIWIQADKDISTIHQLGANIKQFYK